MRVCAYVSCSRGFRPSLKVGECVIAFYTRVCLCATMQKRACMYACLSVCSCVFECVYMRVFMCMYLRLYASVLLGHTSCA